MSRADRAGGGTADVAIVIPCYNHGAHLPEAVASAKAQTLPPAEIVIVDDGSTDPATLAAIDDQRRAGIRVLTQANQGLAAARNAGVRATSTPYYVPLDADDRLQAAFLAHLRPVFATSPRCSHVYCHARLFGARSGRWRCPPYDPRRLLCHNLCTATALVRRAAFDAVGGYARDMTTGFEDWDFWLALCAAGYHGRCVPRPLFEYRQHPAGVSMRDRVEQARGPMLRRLCAHHRALCAARLHLPPDASDDEILAERAAACALDALERARLWQLLRIFGGPDGSAAPQPSVWPSAPSGTRPSARLALARASRAADWLRRLKASRWLRSYAAWQYGRDAGAADPGQVQAHSAVSP